MQHSDFPSGSSAYCSSFATAVRSFYALCAQGLWELILLLLILPQKFRTFLQERQIRLAGLRASVSDRRFILSSTVRIC